MTFTPEDLEGIRAIGEMQRQEVIKQNTDEVSENVVEEPTIIIKDEEENESLEDAVVYIEDDVDEEDDSVESVTGKHTAPPTLDDAIAAYKDISNNEIRMKFASLLHADTDKYRKQLIIDNGFTPEEAADAAWNRLNRVAKTETAKYLEENPNLGIITIDKSQEAQLEFTEEEKAKISKSTALKIVVVEEKELATLQMAPIKSNEKASFLRQILGSLSKYGLPMPNYGDFVTFAGAKTIQLTAAYLTEDMSPAERINLRANLVYDCLLGGTKLRKRDENDDVVMTYENFINNFPFYDLDMAIYTILCASTEEKMPLPIQCNDCGTITDITVDLKTILDVGEDTPEYFKDRIDKIFKARDIPSEMESLEAWDASYRVKSLNGQYIYTLQQPSIAKMISVSRLTVNMGTVPRFYTDLISWVKEVRIWDEGSQGYVLLTDSRDEIDLLFQFISGISEKELTALGSFIGDRVYFPTFRTPMTCSNPHCGKDHEASIDVDTLVFQRVLATQEVIG